MFKIGTLNLLEVVLGKNLFEKAKNKLLKEILNKEEITMENGNLKLTEQVILEVFKNIKEPLTIAEVCDLLETYPYSSVYASIKELTKSGLILKLPGTHNFVFNSGLNRVDRETNVDMDEFTKHIKSYIDNLKLEIASLKTQRSNITFKIWQLKNKIRSFKATLELIKCKKKER